MMKSQPDSSSKPKLQPLKTENPHSKLLWLLFFFAVISAGVLSSQSLIPQHSAQKSDIAAAEPPVPDRRVSLPIVPPVETAQAVAQLSLPPDIQESVLAGLKNKKLRLVRMPLLTDNISPTEVDVSSAGVNQHFKLTPQSQVIVFPIDNTSLLNIRAYSPVSKAATAITADSFGPIRLSFPLVENPQITLLIIAE